MQISLALPAGYHYTQGANSNFSTLSLSPSAPVDFKPASGSLESGGTINVGFRRKGDGSTEARGRVLAKAYYCQDEDVCLFEKISFDLRFLPASGSDSSASQDEENVVELRHSIRS